MTAAPRREDARTEEGWQLAHATAESYERYLVPAVFEQWAERVVDAADPQPGERVLDVACGTGIVARTAAPRVGAAGAVAAIDVNAGMLAVAGRVAGDIEPAIEWREGNAVDLPYDDASFDVALCQQGLQFCSDRAQAAHEMHRVLKLGGRLVLAVWSSLDNHPALRASDGPISEYLGAEAAEGTSAPFSLSDPSEVRALVEGAGFANVHVELSSVDVRFPSGAAMLEQVLGSTPLAGAIAALPADQRSALGSDLDAALDSYTDDLGVSFPWQSYIVSAEK